MLTGSQRGYFYHVWSSVGLAGERGAGNATWSKIQSGKFPLKTAFVMSVYYSQCV